MYEKSEKPVSEINPGCREKKENESCSIVYIYVGVGIQAGLIHTPQTTNMQSMWVEYEYAKN